MGIVTQSSWSAEPSPAFAASDGPAPRTDSPSEPVAKPDGRLGTVGYAIGAQRRGQVEGRAAINQTSILSANEEARGDVEVGAPAVHESSSSLCRGSSRIGGIEHAATDAGPHKGCEVPQSIPVTNTTRPLILLELYTLH